MATRLGIATEVHRDDTGFRRLPLARERCALGARICEVQVGWARNYSDFDRNMRRAQSLN